jgi:hypothetical protein
MLPSTNFTNSLEGGSLGVAPSSAHLGRAIFRQYRQRIHRIVDVLTERNLTGALVVDLTVE